MATLRAAIASLITTVVPAFFPFAVRAQPVGCKLAAEVASISTDLLPGLAVAPPHSGQNCPQVVSADFNNDGKPDYAAVLIERVAARKTPQGDDWLNAYVVILLSAELPYSHYFASFVPGHATSSPERLELALRDRDHLEVVVLRYSRTVYAWGPHGVVVIGHQAD